MPQSLMGHALSLLRGVVGKFLSRFKREKELQSIVLAENRWKAVPKRVIALYAKTQCLFGISPEYLRT